jgi:ribosomal protein S19
VKTLALVAWVPVVVGAILATYGNTAWNDVGVATWMVGLAIQFGSFVVWLRPGRGGL